jgi:hypothetical protein
MSALDPSRGAPLSGPSQVTPPARWIRAVGFLLGVLLLAAAAFVLIGQREELLRCWQAARAAPAWLVLAILLLPLVNWLLTSLIFWALTRRFGAVGLREMSMLIGSAWLLNMLPFKPGLMGRIAYHKAISGIPIATSLAVTVTALLTGGVGIVLAISAQVAINSSLRAAVPARLLAPIIAIVFALALLPGAAFAWINARKGRPALAGGPAAAFAVAVRVADTHVWALRYFLAFHLIGLDQPYGVCVVVSGVSQIAGQFPIQFGLREWSVGISSAVLRPIAPGGGAGAAIAVPGLTADLVCRAAEIACALPVGLVSTLLVYRHLRRKRG